MKLPNADAAIVEQRKIVDYLLSISHPDGTGKAPWVAARSRKLGRLKLPDGDQATCWPSPLDPVRAHLGLFAQ